MKRRSGKYEELLVPGGAAEAYAGLGKGGAEESSRRWFAYSLLSSIRDAIRERAVDQARSTVRSDSSSASAVSTVVKPAK
jgi:hypothetical protein